MDLMIHDNEAVLECKLMYKFLFDLQWIREHDPKILALPHQMFHSGSVAGDEQTTVVESDDAVHISEVLIEHEL